MAGPRAGLEASGGPEPLALVLLSRPHVQQRAAGTADRVPHRRVAGLQPRVWCGQDVTGRGGRGRLAAHRVALVPPGVPRAVEDAYVLVAVELHQPEAEGGRVAVEPTTERGPMPDLASRLIVAA